MYINPLIAAIEYNNVFACKVLMMNENILINFILSKKDPLFEKYRYLYIMEPPLIYAITHEKVHFVRLLLRHKKINANIFWFVIIFNYFKGVYYQFFIRIH